MWYVYILLCENQSLYTGISNNPQQRFLDHKNGKGGRYTRLHKPVSSLYTEQLPDKSAALKRERQIKGWSRKKKIKTLKLESVWNFSGLNILLSQKVWVPGSRLLEIFLLVAATKESWRPEPKLRPWRQPLLKNHNQLF